MSADLSKVVGFTLPDRPVCPTIYSGSTNSLTLLRRIGCLEQARLANLRSRRRRKK